MSATERHGPERLFLVLNGPNLNLLGKREPHIYGHETLSDVAAACRRLGDAHGFRAEFRQSNAEHELIDWIHEASPAADGLVINPGGYSHTSIAIMDALAACACPIVEVHISNIHRREEFRHHSFVSKVATAVICGCGTQGYELALLRLAQLCRQAG